LLPMYVRVMAAECGEALRPCRHGTHTSPHACPTRRSSDLVGLGLGDAGALLHVRVQRHGDRGEDADDRDDDEELDQREAALTAQRDTFTDYNHVTPAPRSSRSPRDYELSVGQRLNSGCQTR